MKHKENLQIVVDKMNKILEKWRETNHLHREPNNLDIQSAFLSEFRRYVYPGDYHSYQSLMRHSKPLVMVSEYRVKSILFNDTFWAQIALEIDYGKSIVVQEIEEINFSKIQQITF